MGGRANGAHSSVPPTRDLCSALMRDNHPVVDRLHPPSRRPAPGSRSGPRPRPRLHRAGHFGNGTHCAHPAHEQRDGICWGCNCTNGTAPCMIGQTCLWFSEGCSIGCKVSPAWCRFGWARFGWAQCHSWRRAWGPGVHGRRGFNVRSAPTDRYIYRAGGKGGAFKGTGPLLAPFPV